ncbi:hypothetical protein V1511DRAFT_511525 [Dipodascopsis uninucleata]
MSSKKVTGGNRNSKGGKSGFQLPPIRFSYDSNKSQSNTAGGSASNIPNDKVAPAIRSKMMGYRLIIMSLPLLAVTSVLLYKRVYLGETQRHQEGFITSDGIPILYKDLTEEESEK